MDPTTFRMMWKSSGPSLDPMVLVFNTTLLGADQIARVPLRGNHNVTIDWGDGTTTVHTGAANAVYTRTYATPGTYNVRITGTADGFGSTTLTQAQRNNFWKCLSFGDLGMTSLQGAFRNCIRFIEAPLTLPTTVTNLSSMFSGVQGYTQNINSWNTGNVTSMSGMFNGSSFNQPIGSWDTSSVIDMSLMFASAGNFNQNIGGWNTANVISMSAMFEGTTAFNQNIGGWNTANVTTMLGMFDAATAFNCGQAAGVVHTLMQRTATTGWRTQGISSINMQRMFQNASSFAGNISNWCVTGILAQPTNFATGSNANFTVARRPTWNACPFPD